MVDRVYITVTDADGVILERTEVDVATAARSIAGLRRRKGRTVAAAATLTFTAEAVDEARIELSRLLAELMGAHGADGSTTNTGGTDMATTVERKCDHCGRKLEWKLEQLEDHLERINRGEHAACACDDDCATECAPWSRRRLLRAISKLQVRSITHHCNECGEQVTDY